MTDGLENPVLLNREEAVSNDDILPRGDPEIVCVADVAGEPLPIPVRDPMGLIDA